MEIEKKNVTEELDNQENEELITSTEVEEVKAQKSMKDGYNKNKQNDIGMKEKLTDTENGIEPIIKHNELEKKKIKKRSRRYNTKKHSNPSVKFLYLYKNKLSELLQPEKLFSSIVSTVKGMKSFKIAEKLNYNDV